MSRGNPEDVRLPEPKFGPPPRKAVLFEYELDEGNLRMLRALQNRELYPSLSMAMRECLGIVTTLMKATEDGFEVVLLKDGQHKSLGIDSLVPRVAPEGIAEAAAPPSDLIEVVISNDLEAKQGYSYERAMEKGFPLYRYKSSPLPDGEWVGRLDYKVVIEGDEAEDRRARMDCHFTFIREVTCDGLHRGQPGERYRTTIWKQDSRTFTPQIAALTSGR